MGHFLISRRNRYQSWKLTYDFDHRRIQGDQVIQLMVEEADDDFRDFRGPVTLEPMLNPVDAPDGHTYESKTAEYWTQDAGGKSPKTNLVVPRADEAPLPINYRYMAAMYARASWLIQRDLKELEEAKQTLGQSSSDSLQLDEASRLFKFLHGQFLEHKNVCIRKAYKSAQSMFDLGHIDQAGLDELKFRIEFIEQSTGSTKKANGDRFVFVARHLSLTGITVTW